MDKKPSYLTYNLQNSNPNYIPPPRIIKPKWGTSILFYFFNKEAQREAKNLVSGLRIFTCRVQIPFGPRKSGIPQEVEIPAPVNTTRCLLYKVQRKLLETLIK